ncbi:MAG: diguanylate cyclase [Gemmatimonadota bacterium]
MRFLVEQDRCVGCLACVRVCPTGAIAVPQEASTVMIMEDSCIRCGLCLPACPHDAIDASGALETALRLAGQPDTVLILGTEASAHFYPATPEQVINACYAAGFPMVSRGVLGDELVAAEYQRLWGAEGWGTMLRSTDPVMVAAIGLNHPELIPYLAPIVAPPVAEARYLREAAKRPIKVVYAGVWPVEGGHGELDAVITFGDLIRLFELKGIRVGTQPMVFSRVPEERRRHLSVAGGLPLNWVESRAGAPRLLRVRGLEALGPLAQSVATDRIDLGFVDLLSADGLLDHPMSGPRERLFWRRSVVQVAEPPRSPAPVVDARVRASVGASFQFRIEVPAVDPADVAAVLEAIGTGPNEVPWDCGACGYATCGEFARAVAIGRNSLRLCPPYLSRVAATDMLTGLATVQVLKARLGQEVERSKRSGERFAVLFLDLDHLKEINDQLGHESGNEVLREVSSELQNAVRASDLAARYGGDEFVVILTRTDKPGATRVAEALRSGVERVGQRLGYGMGFVTVSIGIAEYDPAQPTEEDLIKLADRAMYRAKAAGRNMVV